VHQARSMRDLPRIALVAMGEPGEKLRDLGRR